MGFMKKFVENVQEGLDYSKTAPDVKKYAIRMASLIGSGGRLAEPWSGGLMLLYENNDGVVDSVVIADGNIP